MRHIFPLALIAGFLAPGCGLAPNSARGGSLKDRDLSDSPGTTTNPGTTTDPIVAHFFNTASLANDDAAAVAATEDGGANADAGN